MLSLATLAVNALPSYHLRLGLLGNHGRQIQTQCVIQMRKVSWIDKPYTKESARRWGCVRILNPGFSIFGGGYWECWVSDVTSLQGCVHLLAINYGTPCGLHKALTVLQPLEVICHKELDDFEHPGYRTIYIDRRHTCETILKQKKRRKKCLSFYYDSQSLIPFTMKLVHVASIQKMRALRKVYRSRQ